MSTRTLGAFVDESQSNQSQDPHTYLLAAAICGPDVIGDVRDQVAGLRLRGDRKLHWHDESPKRRAVIAAAIAELPIDALVVVRNGMAGERVERRRRLCVRRMLFELDDRGVGAATFESRGPADDRRDRNLADSMRACRELSSLLRVDHEKGPLEALLWIPDALCGAVTAHRLGQDTYLKAIECRIDVTMLTLEP